jgi:hypothetical protein
MYLYTPPELVWAAFFLTKSQKCLIIGRWLGMVVNISQDSLFKLFSSCTTSKMHFEIALCRRRCRARNSILILPVLQLRWKTTSNLHFARGAGTLKSMWLLPHTKQDYLSDWFYWRNWQTHWKTTSKIHWRCATHRGVFKAAAKSLIYNTKNGGRRCYPTSRRHFIWTVCPKVEWFQLLNSGPLLW